eukprot:GILI01040238.1.p1 GENE.GILI01040238.1~~GILI01040238.1.p1  ORF type:complete len:117 (+),score=13.02 GILI01040238.1:72-422(+)
MPADSRVLLISNLPGALNGERLYEMFGAYGAIRQIRLGDDPATKGTAIVVYSHCDDAEKAMSGLQGQQHGKRVLNVCVYDSELHRRAIDKRKRQREREIEYSSKLKGDAASAPAAL